MGSMETLSDVSIITMVTIDALGTDGIARDATVDKILKKKIIRESDDCFKCLTNYVNKIITRFHCTHLFTIIFIRLLTYYALFRSSIRYT